jgi:hypothetical protein
MLSLPEMHVPEVDVILAIVELLRSCRETLERDAAIVQALRAGKDPNKPDA